MVLSFPPEVFGRLEPEIYLQRHLENGLRPSGNRSFETFRPIHSQTGNIKNTIGSSLVRAGGSIIVCGITAGTTETIDGAGVYPNVEIVRGSARSGPPTEEEMVLSQQCYELLNQVFKDKQEVFDIPEIEDKKLVFNVTIQVLSRTGPCFDLVWNGILLALKTTTVPKLTVNIDTREVNYDNDKSEQGINLGERYNFDQHSSSFGMVELRNYDDPTKPNSTVLLADIDGATEEACIKSRVNVVGNKDGELNKVSITVAESTASGGNQGISLTKNDIKRALDLAKKN